MLHCDKTQRVFGNMWEINTVENTSHRQVFSTFLECSQMSGVFYHYNNVIQSLGFLICFDIDCTHCEWKQQSTQINKLV